MPNWGEVLKDIEGVRSQTRDLSRKAGDVVRQRYLQAANTGAGTSTASLALLPNFTV